MIKRVRNITVGTCLVLALAGLVHSAGAQGSITSARQLGMGRTFAASPEGGWHLYGNPALMDAISHEYTLRMNGLRPFGLTDLQEISAAGSLSRPYGTWGAGFHRFGNSMYQEIKAATGFSKGWDPLLIGGTLHYTHVAIQRYGSAGTVGLNVGTALKLGPRGWIGAAATNLNRPTIGASDEELPQVMVLGASWELIEGSLFTTEILKALRFPVSWRAGMEIKVAGPLVARIGVHTQPVAWSAGIGIQLGTFAFDFGIEHHQMLGFSYGIGMGLDAAL